MKCCYYTHIKATNKLNTCTISTCNWECICHKPSFCTFMNSLHAGCHSKTSASTSPLWRCALWVQTQCQEMKILLRINGKLHRKLASGYEGSTLVDAGTFWVRSELVARFNVVGKYFGWEMFCKYIWRFYARQQLLCHLHSLTGRHVVVFDNCGETTLYIQLLKVKVLSLLSVVCCTDSVRWILLKDYYCL